MTTKCKYDVPWCGPCKKPTVDGVFCKTHTGLKCTACERVAVRGCAWCGQFVCGSPLCEYCTHSMGGFGHEKREPPKPKPEVEPKNPPRTGRVSTTELNHAADMLIAMVNRLRATYHASSFEYIKARFDEKLCRNCWFPQKCYCDPRYDI